MTTLIDDIGRHWHREPVLVRAPSWGRWARAEVVIEGLRRAAQVEAASWRLFDGEQAVSRRDAAALIHPDEARLEDYLDRLGRDSTAPGLILNQLQAASPGCWRGVAPLLSTLYAAFGAPHGGALVDLFLSGRAESFFGAHKDDQDVFMFVVAGCKRVELWRYDSLTQEHGAPGFYMPSHLGQVEIERPPDLVLEARAGDVVYWPAGYWHRVRNLDALTVGISLGLFTRPDPLALLARLAEYDVDAGPRQLHRARRVPGLRPGLDCGQEADGVLAGLAGDADTRAQLSAALASFKSSLGFRATARVPRPASARGQVFRLLAPALLELAQGEDELLVGVAGSLVRYPDDGGLRHALERLRSGEPSTLLSLERAVLDVDRSWEDFDADTRMALLDKLVCDLVEVCAVVVDAEHPAEAAA